jgi:N-methylhydantoinase B
MSPGGGGIGDPLERERAQVEADVRNGLISAKAAHNSYGLETERGEAPPAGPARKHQRG